MKNELGNVNKEKSMDSVATAEFKGKASTSMQDIKYSRVCVWGGNSSASIQ